MDGVANKSQQLIITEVLQNFNKQDHIRNNFLANNLYVHKPELLTITVIKIGHDPVRIRHFVFFYPINANKKEQPYVNGPQQ